LHVLSTPPAFVLSQDQTLHQKTWQPNNRATHTTPTNQDPHRASASQGQANQPNTLLSSQKTNTTTNQRPHKTPAGRWSQHPTIAGRFYYVSLPRPSRQPDVRRIDMLLSGALPCA